MSSFHTHNDNVEELSKSIPSFEESAKVAKILATLSDPTRLRILWFLCHTTECVTDIGLAINMSAPAVSHHLRILKESNIIESKKIGKEMQYHIADNKYADLIHKMIDSMLEAYYND